MTSEFLYNPPNVGSYSKLVLKKRLFDEGFFIPQCVKMHACPVGIRKLRMIGI
jgi:hypothetical protein